MSFQSFGLRPELLRAVKDLGFRDATPIQRDALPPALEGRDVLACAATGSGKTAAFVLPILERLADRPRGGPRALVLTPTRELAAQIAEHLSELAAHTRVSGIAVYGGVGMGAQERAFKSGVDVVVATPGRLLDHMRMPYARFDRLEILVLDEADRMLDMGFLPDIKRILSRLPKQRQTLLFSATMPREIATLSREFLKNPALINQERRAAPPSAVRQAAYPVEGGRKTALFLELLARDDMRSVIVFTRTKARSNRLCDALERAGVSAARIHGNRSQAQREKALDGFREGRVRVLVATDVASRGIDVEELSHVVNFDVPHVPEDYIHRVGRTGRAGATGDGFTFVSPEEEGDFRAIEKAVGIRIPRVKLPEFAYDGPTEELKRRPDAAARNKSRRPTGEAPRGSRRDRAQKKNAARRSHSMRSRDGNPPTPKAPPRSDGPPRHAPPSPSSRPSESAPLNRGRGVLRRRR